MMLPASRAVLGLQDLIDQSTPSGKFSVQLRSAERTLGDAFDMAHHNCGSQFVVAPELPMLPGVKLSACCSKVPTLRVYCTLAASIEELLGFWHAKVCGLHGLKTKMTVSKGKRHTVQPEKKEYILRITECSKLQAEISSKKRVVLRNISALLSLEPMVS